jgi:glycosyltransferase involved in cell wall biosynthesis
MSRLVIIGPSPPPTHGVTISTALAYANPHLREIFDVRHLDTSDGRPTTNLGRWDVENVTGGLLALYRLNRLLRGVPPGIVYLTLSENSGGFMRDSLFIWCARARGWRIAVHIRNSLFREFYTAQIRLMQSWIRRTMGILTGVAVLGDELRSLMNGFVEPERVSVVPNGTPDFDRPSCEPDRWLVLYLSNLWRKKGADHAVRAAQIVAETDSRARFIFAGEWESDEFERYVRDLAEPLGPRLAFVGPVDGDEKARLMASARVLLFPVAWGEGHPRIVLEALAAALPIVTTNRATIAGTVVNGTGGFVLADPDPRELASKVLLLLHDDELHRQMSAGARSRYLEAFTQAEADRRLADWICALAEQT